MHRKPIFNAGFKYFLHSNTNKNKIWYGEFNQ